MYKDSLKTLRTLADEILSGAKEGKVIKTSNITERPLVQRPQRQETETQDEYASDKALLDQMLFIKKMAAEGSSNRALYTESEGGLGESLRPMARRDTPISTDISDREILAKTLAAEAGNEGYEGMLAVGSVIANRVSAKGYGKSLREVILKPGQFSAWNSVTGYAGGEQGQNMDLIKPSEEAYAVADEILSGKYESPVGGATHYYNPSISNPDWGEEAGGDWLKLGNHVFGYGN